MSQATVLETKKEYYSQNILFLPSLDLETTGLSIWKDRFVQLGCCLWLVNLDTKDFEHVADFELNCRSPIPMHPKSIEITGITQEFVDKQFLSAKDVLIRFREFLDIHCVLCSTCHLLLKSCQCICSNCNIKNCKCDKRHEMSFPRVAIHYNGHGFDLPLIICESERCGLGGENYFRSLKLTSSIDLLKTAKEVLDTTKLHRNADGKCSFRLGKVYEALLSKPLLNAHGGLADSHAVIEILKVEFTQFKMHMTAAISGEYDNCKESVINVMSLVRKIVAAMPKDSTKRDVFKCIDKNISHFTQIPRDLFDKKDTLGGGRFLKFSRRYFSNIFSFIVTLA